MYYTSLYYDCEKIFNHKNYRALLKCLYTYNFDYFNFNFYCCLRKEIIFYLIFIISLQYVENNKNADNDWFRLESNEQGTKWFGKCWYIHNLLKYEFSVEFDVSTEFTICLKEYYQLFLYQYLQ